MASPKTLVGRLLGPLLFRQSTIREVSDAGPRLRRLTLGGDDLRPVSAQPGDKLQVFLPDAGMRTYTPVRWDSRQGTVELLVYLHGDSTPGARWGRQAKVGDTCQFFGPRSSVPLTEMTGPVVLFGDETSFALAHSLALLRPDDARVSYVFEVSSAADAAATLPALGLGAATVIERKGSSLHLAAVADALAKALQAHPDARTVMTGQAQSIQALRASLGERGLKPSGKNKAYWSVGKSGLD